VFASSLVNMNLVDLVHNSRMIFSLSVVLLYTSSTKYPEFRSMYLDIMHFLCMTSLVAYLFLRLFPDIQNALPIVYSETEVAYRSAGLLLFHDAVSTLNRNYSIFWEPGVFAVFIIYGLVLDLTSRNAVSSARFAALILALLTTGSTLAYIFAPLFLITRIRKFGNVTSILNTFFLIAMLIFLALAWILGVSDISPASKFEQGNYSFFMRYLSLTVDFAIFRESIFGVGLARYGEMVSAATFGVLRGSFNSLAYSLAVYGLPFTGLFLGLYMAAPKNLGLKGFEKGLAILAFLGIFFTQSLIYAPVLLCSVAYSISERAQAHIGRFQKSI